MSANLGYTNIAETEQRSICKIFEIISLYLGLCICQIFVRECSLIIAIIIVLSQDNCTFKVNTDNQTYLHSMFVRMYVCRTGPHTQLICC